MKAPGRPFGLILAIILSVLLFTVMPLMQVAFILMLRHRFSEIDFLETGGASGGSIEGVDDIQLVLALVMSVVFLIIAVLAWRGKPKVIRFIFVGAVSLFTLVTVATTIATLQQEATFQQGIDSSASFFDSLHVVRLLMTVLIALYVIWYVNRAPARAFYRGYYLPDPAENG